MSDEQSHVTAGKGRTAGAKSRAITPLAVGEAIVLTFITCWVIVEFEQANFSFNIFAILEFATIPLTVIVVFAIDNSFGKRLTKWSSRPSLVMIAASWFQALSTSIFLSVVVMVVVGIARPQTAGMIVTHDPVLFPVVVLTALAGLLGVRCVWWLSVPNASSFYRVLTVDCQNPLHAVNRSSNPVSTRGVTEYIELLDNNSFVDGNALSEGGQLRCLDRLPVILANTDVDVIVISEHSKFGAHVWDIVECLPFGNLDVRLALDVEPLKLDSAIYDKLGSMRTLKLHYSSLTLGQARIKRIFDIIVSLLLLILVSPLMIACAIAVKLSSPGPVIFRQTRRGHSGQNFTMLKFRSFYNDLADKDAASQTTRSDARIVPIGRVLRKHSLDELPQLFNVLRGSMSIVGPRPHALQTTIDGQKLESLCPRYDARHRVKPGITGWAQIKGWRGNLDSPDKLSGRLNHDLDYIQNWSLYLDCKIILGTVSCLFHDPAAF